MGSGGSAVDAMVIGCLGVESRAERFLSYLAMYSLGAKAQSLSPSHTQDFVLKRREIPQKEREETNGIFSSHTKKTCKLCSHHFFGVHIISESTV
jgi:hypothetical protein